MDKSPNFEYLRPHWPELSALGAHAEQYVYSDSQSALIKLRCFAENLVGIVYREWQLPTLPNEKFIDRLENHAFTAIVDRAIIDKLHAIRKEGNKAAHEGKFGNGATASDRNMREGLSSEKVDSIVRFEFR